MFAVNTKCSSADFPSDIKFIDLACFLRIFLEIPSIYGSQLFLSESQLVAPTCASQLAQGKPAGLAALPAASPAQ